jgi:CRISPR-associated protein Cas4
MKVNVSSLREYEFCPRAVYLKDILKLESETTPEQARGLVGHALRKELSLRQAKILKKIKDKEQLKTTMRDELENIIIEIPYIYKEKLKGVNIQELMPEIIVEIESEINTMQHRLENLIEQHGLKQALQQVTPSKVEYGMQSDTLGLTGIVDKIMQPLTPVEIKTGKTGDGVWEGDRLQLAAYAMLLEEKHSQQIQQGLVEYTRIQEQRPVQITEKLRRKVIQTRDQITEIRAGSIPEICPHGNGKKCDKCTLKNKCYKI